MKEKKFRLRPRYLIVAALLLLLLLSGAVGKYVQTIQHSGTVTFTASLAENVVLQEHEAVRQDDGSYVLSGDIVYKNDYILIPGLDIPKDPHIVITGKTEIPAYLYIEIVDAGVDAEISYQLRTCWLATTLKTPEHSGTVYVYSTDGSTPFPFTSNPENDIYILANDEVLVGQHLKCDTDQSDAGVLTIYAYLVEAASVGTP